MSATPSTAGTGTTAGTTRSRRSRRIAPGTTLRFECNDAANGHFSPGSTAADVATLDFSKVNPVTGPVFIDGAEPGDALKITFGDFEPIGRGLDGEHPGLRPARRPVHRAGAAHVELRRRRSPALYGPGAKVPLKPFTGTIGLAPAEPGLHSIVPPRRVGGNLDVRDLAAGSVLWLPVEVAGGLFSVGDTHAAQGDGEVCGTAIESAMAVTLTFELEKAANLAFPRFRTPGPVTRHHDGAGYDVTTGIGPDLMQGARDAVSGMIDLLAAREKMSPVEAYMLCSVAGDLRISCIVDVPNWVVSFYMPRQIFA